MQSSTSYVYGGLGISLTKDTIVRMPMTGSGDASARIEVVVEGAARPDHSHVGYGPRAVYVYSSDGLRRTDKSDLSERTVSTASITTVRVDGDTVYALSAGRLFRVSPDGARLEPVAAANANFPYSVGIREGKAHFGEGTSRSDATNWRIVEVSLR